MAGPKRKRADDVEDDHYSEVSASYECRSSDDEIDISHALSGKKAKVARPSDSSDDDLQDFLQETVAKRNIKSGTEVIKKAKGKGKIAKGEVGGGSFQSMGLHPSLLRSLTLQGYRIPTPIQRLSIPSLLANPPKDLVGMARTGSGKTLAYIVPLIQRLGGRHSNTFGARALILIPTRELALQILKVGKELARGWHSRNGEHAGDKEAEDSKQGQNLRWGLVVGGEGMDEQFEMITTNPDIIIATPGRLLHLIVEMKLDLKSVQYVVFDEADRLFEMGFETALTEIIHRLQPCRQTLLFSATLPKSLVEFAKAGLQDPKLVRLDAESKISSDLRMAFFSVKQAEKEACLLALLRDVIKVPLRSTDSEGAEPELNKKNKGKAKHAEQFAAPRQTVVFVATKHHVEFATNLLTTAGYAVSHIYGSLDQSARTYQMDQFRRGFTNVLVVTDVAARGIDIPVLGNVVNYDFPQGARVFVHRVGRTARAGRQGWAWSFVTNTELPYLLDLQLFLGRPLQNDVTEDGDGCYVESLVLGTFERSKIDEDVEYIRRLEDANHSLPALRDVMKRGHALYERGKGKASPPSYKRAKEMIKDPRWSLAGSDSGVHPVLLRGAGAQEARSREEARKALLRSVNSFKPPETVFEIGTKGKAANGALMKQRRKALSKAAQRALASTSSAGLDEPDGEFISFGKDAQLATEDDIAAVFDTSSKKQDYRDSEFYMSHYQTGAAAEKGFSLSDGATFAQQAQNATFDLAGDDGVAGRQKHQLKWDKKKKRFVQGDGAGADNVKLVTTESGAKLPATYRSGRFDEWQAKTRVTLPKVGEAENEAIGRRSNSSAGQRFRHKAMTPAKPLDKLHVSYERRLRQTKKSEEDGGNAKPAAGSSKRSTKAVGRYGSKPIVKVKSELKTSEQIRKHRKIMEHRKAKNARPSRKAGKKKGRR
ncbi:putative DBP10CT (NUC160) domain containing protein [Lyophyllum shimeji]|uniref:RNA helicase n=1 Tax=Lyophyllum shimeji TaxID=47721 RepID=A0A9P3PL42_LYOSH|nr:putative DBP10CT (NUC160) domain containing protein [Lyophyllum shimeji]